MVEGALLRAWNSLGSRRAPVTVAAVALLLCGTSLGGGRTLDDWVLTVVARGDGAALGLSSRRWDCFRFTTGDPLQNATMMSRGVLLPWWSDPGLKLAFFRPLAGLSHVLDERWWPSDPIKLHLHSLVWFAGLLAAVWAVYHRLGEDPRITHLAFALYAWDDAHGATLSWLSNRSALMSGLFGCASIAAHDLWRRGGRGRHGWLAFACFALSCLASELFVGALAYLVAYAVFLDRAPLRERARSLGGYAVTTIGWRTGWSLAGYGAHGSGAYVDPLADPAGFMASAPRKWLSLLQGQLGVIPADFGFLGPARYQALWSLTAVMTLIAAAVLLAPCVADARGRFWLGGALLSLLPMAASFPSDRLLLFVGLGFMPLFARAFWLAASGLGGSAARRWPARGLAVAFFGVHGIVAPLLLPLRAGQMGRMARAESDAFRDLRAQVGASKQTLIVLNAPSLVLVSYAQVRLEAERLPPLPGLYVLSAADSPVVATREGAFGLTLRADQGFLGSPLERHYRALSSSLSGQGRVHLRGLTVQVTESRADGRPQAVRLTFSEALSHFAFACWTDGRFRRCELPEPGRSLRLPAGDLGRILFGPGAASAS